MTLVSVLVRNFKTFLTNFELQFHHGIQKDGSSPSWNVAEAFLNDIKKNQTTESKKWSLKHQLV